MARAAAERGLPHELPVMAALAESGLRNLRGESYHGFFGMHESLNRGEYRGFPRRPELQVKWFIDTATSVRQRLVAETRPDPAADPSSFGSGSPTSSGPPRKTASGDQPPQGGPPACGRASRRPVYDDVTPPRLVARIAARPASACRRRDRRECALPRPVTASSERARASVSMRAGQRPGGLRRAATRSSRGRFRARPGAGFGPGTVRACG